MGWGCWTVTEAETVAKAKAKAEAAESCSKDILHMSHELTSTCSPRAPLLYFPYSKVTFLTQSIRVMHTERGKADRTGLDETRTGQEAGATTGN